MQQQQQAAAELDAAGGGSGSTSTGFVTGTKCTASGTYKASNKYMELILVYEAGEVFLPFSDGKKTTWFALAPSSKSGFESMKVAPGSI
jgi:hypothetical protein